MLYLKNEQKQLTDFLQAGKHSSKLKVDQEIFGWAWSKMGVASLVTGPSQCAPPHPPNPLSAGGVEPPTKFSKRRGLTGPQL